MITLCTRNYVGKMNRSKLLICVSAFLFIAGYANILQAQDYLKPIRPFYEGRNACWNAFSNKFIYVPAFDFKPVDKAVKYRYTVTLSDGNGTAGEKWSFESEVLLRMDEICNN